MAYYQHNSLGSSFPGVDTTLRFPYKEIADDPRRPRSTSNPPLPPPPNALLPPNMGVAVVEKWADVLFNFTAEYPDELTIDVSWACTLIHCVYTYYYIDIVLAET